MKKTRFLSFLLPLFAGVSHAAVIAYDGFNIVGNSSDGNPASGTAYVKGDDLGATAYGTGWSTGWQNNTGIISNYTTGSGFAFADSGPKSVERSLSATIAADQVYFSLMFNKSSDHGSSAFKLLNGSTELLWSGIYNSEWSLLIPGGTRTNGAAAPLASNVTLTGVLDYANNLATIWAGNLASASYDASTGNAVGAVVQVAFTGNLGVNKIVLAKDGNHTNRFDSITLASAGSDVGLSVIPEPTAALLGGLGLLVLLRRRR